MAEAAGRMFATASDIVAILDEGSNANWTLSLIDPLTNFSEEVPVSSSFKPHDKVYTQLVMGNFKGDNLLEPLAFYASSSPQEWGMAVFAPVDPKTEGVPIQGAEFQGGQEPVPGSIVTGDFNGDGRDEIAALLEDQQTIAFYAVDPQTLEISQTSTFKLPDPLAPGQATLAAGRFRKTPNAELVAFGQIENGKPGYTIFSIQIAATANGPFTASLARTYRFPDYHHANGALALAAPIVSPAETTNLQLVLGIKTDPYPEASWVNIGTFDTNFAFEWQSQTNLGVYQLLSMQIGNFDHRLDGNAHAQGLQLETYAYKAFQTENGTKIGQRLSIYDIDVPSPIKKLTDWLKKNNDIFNTGLGDTDKLTLGIAVPADIQGRSLRLGWPEIVTLPGQIQPDIVLSIPPMHVDWIMPNRVGLDENKYPGCQNPKIACLLNLTVYPWVPGPGIGFGTSFAFNSSTDNSSVRKTTTSWGVSVKTTASGKVSFAAGQDGTTAEIKDTAQYVHDNKVSKTYNSSLVAKTSLTETTGFADHVFYTQKGLTVYYYPVIGKTSCPNAESSCQDDGKSQTYVDFSIPTDAAYYDLDGTNEDWYQPVHEPGNVFSYPWNLDQLSKEFTSGSTILNNQSNVCQATSTSTSNYTTSWSTSSKKSVSNGSTNSFSNNLSMSYSEQAGFGGGKEEASFSVDIGTSTSLETLNESTTALDSSSGITITTPHFTSEINTWPYAFASYIFGQKNPYQSLQSIDVKDPEGNPTDLQNAGPLFVGFIADVASGPSECQGAVDSAWWEQVYQQPDVALNHPARWNWDGGTQKVTFNQPSQEVSPLVNPFYQMKGFFISQSNSTNGTNLSDAKAGNQLTLSVRVYNYSLTDTIARPAE